MLPLSPVSFFCQIPIQNQNNLHTQHYNFFCCFSCLKIKILPLGDGNRLNITLASLQLSMHPQEFARLPKIATLHVYIKIFQQCRTDIRIAKIRNFGHESCLVKNINFASKCNLYIPKLITV